MKTIYCIQTVSLSGHHDSYTDIYCLTLLKLGYRVVLLINNYRSLFNNELNIYKKNNLFYFYNIDSNNTKLIRKFNNLFLKIIRKSWNIIRKLFLFFLFIPPLIKEESEIQWPSQSSIEAIINKTGFHSDLLFFLYLDPYFMGYSSFIHKLQLNWTGLLFNASYLKKKNYYLYKSISSSSCKGIAMLDPRYLEYYKKIFKKKRFTSLPDVIDTTLSEKIPQCCIDIKEKSANKNIIMLLGSLSGRKGICTLLKIAYNHPNSPYFFAFCGKISWDSFNNCSKADINLLRSCIKTPPDNCYFYLNYFETEAELNHLFLISDIIYSVYEKFDSSSGIIGKAAYFNKPILVQKNGLMESYIQKGPSGESVNPYDVNAIYNKFDIIMKNKYNYNYNVYSDEISIENLEKKLKYFISASISENNND